MTPKQLRFLTASGGIAAVLLYGAVAALMADAPGVTETDVQILEWVRGHRTTLLTSAYLWGLCSCATLTFLAGLGGVLKRAGGEPVLTTLGVGGGFAIFTLALGGFIFLAVAAYRAESLPAPTVKLLNDASLVGVAMTGFPTVVSMAGYLGAMFHRGLLSAPVRWFGVVVTFAHLVSGGAYAASGMLSPAGIGVYVAPVMYYLWFLVVSIELLVRPPPAT